MTRWYRAYVGTVKDDKLAEVAAVAGCSRSVVIATWHAVLESAAEGGAGGNYETTPRRIAALLGEPLTVIEAVFTAMTEIGMIGDGYIPAWSKRQFESDSSTERSRKHRETKRNGDATAMQRCATPPDTETDTDTCSLRSQVAREPAPAPASLPDGEPIRTQKAIAEGYAKAKALPPAMHRINVWLEAGYTHAEIIAVVGSVLERGKAPSSLAYFDNALREARAAIQPAQGQAPAPKLSHDEQIKANIAKMTPDMWRKRVKAWQTGGAWPPMWPFPIELHTPVPDDILIECGVKNPRVTGPPPIAIAQRKAAEAHH